MQLSHLQSSLADRRDAAARRRAAAEEDARNVLGVARAQGREYLTRGEDSRVARLIGLRDRADRELAELDRGLAECDAAAAEEADAARLYGQSYPTPAAYRRPAYDQVARVGREERTYHPGNDPQGLNFALDVARGMVFGDPGANERLLRHGREESVERGVTEQRASTTANFSGIVVPEYLVDFFAPAVSAGRPFADSLTHHDLPPTGMTINFGRLTTPSAVTLQASQNDAVGNADLDDTIDTENVQTAAGYTVVSRQAVDRGVFTDETVMSELMRRSAVTLDSTLLNQASTGADALAATAGTVAFTTTAPTAVLLWPKIFSALNNVEAALLDQAPPDTIAMHSRRFKWLCSQVSSSWPVMGAAMVPPQQQAMVLTNEYGSAVRAVLNDGTKVVVDSNIVTNQGVGTNQDAAYAYASREMHLFEDPNAPYLLRAEQYAAPNLGVLFVCWSYFAYCFRRYPGAVQSVTGTGMVSPTF